jgi:hypothetical protein
MSNLQIDIVLVALSISLSLLLALCMYLIANIFFEISFLQVFFLEIISFFGRSFLNFISRRVLPEKL